MTNNKYKPGTKVGNWTIVEELPNPHGTANHRVFLAEHSCGSQAKVGIQRLYDIARKNNVCCAACISHSGKAKPKNLEVSIGHVEGWNTWVVPDIGRSFIAGK